MITTLRAGKARLSALVECAARGEEVVITVRGKPKARLCPLARSSHGDRRRGAHWEKTLREARETYSTGVSDSATKIMDEVRGDRT